MSKATIPKVYKKGGQICYRKIIVSVKIFRFYLFLEATTPCFYGQYNIEALLDIANILSLCPDA